jgi:hypothetical protein
MEKGRASGTSSAAYPTWIIRSRKDGLGLPEFSFPLAQTRWRDKENLFFSLSRRGSLTQASKTGDSLQHALQDEIDAVREVFFRRNLDQRG